MKTGELLAMKLGQVHGHRENSMVSLVVAQSVKSFVGQFGDRSIRMRSRGLLGEGSDEYDKGWTATDSWTQGWKEGPVRNSEKEFRLVLCAPRWSIRRTYGMRVTRTMRDASRMKPSVQTLL